MKKILIISCLLNLLLSSVCFGVTQYAVVTPSGNMPAGGRAAGYDKAYSSLATWEAAEDADIKTGTTHHIVHIIGDWTSSAPEDSYLQIWGWTTDFSYRIEVVAPEAGDILGGVTDSTRHTGVSDFTKYVILNRDHNTIGVYEDHVRFDGLQMLNTYDHASRDVLQFVSGQINADNHSYISNCLLTKAKSSGVTVNGMGIRFNDSSCNAVVWNSLILNPHENQSTVGDGISALVTGLTVFNTGIYGWDDGIVRWAGRVWAINSFVYNNDNDFNGANVVVDYCASDDNDGTNNVAENVWDNNFVDRTGTSNFKLVEHSNLDDSGTNDPSQNSKWGSLFSTDIEGDAYEVAQWPVGFHEPDTGAPAPAPVPGEKTIIMQWIISKAKGLWDYLTEAFSVNPVFAGL